MARITINDLPDREDLARDDMAKVVGGSTVQLVTATNAVPTSPSSALGIAPGHAYTVIGTYTSEDGEQTTVLRNPWGTSE